jgi:periplasmic divalent cation tolerance protein
MTPKAPATNRSPTRRPKRSTPRSILVFTTLPQRAAAEALARELLAARLAACIQIGAAVESLYHWKGEIETASETPMAIKTRVELYAQVERAIRDRHPYELPEIVAVPITDGLPAYVDWIAAETAVRAS